MRGNSSSESKDARLTFPPYVCVRVLSACGWRFDLYTQSGTFDVDDDLSPSDKAALLAAFGMLACDGIPNCDVLWKEDTRRRLGDSRSLGGTMTLVVAMRVVLDKDSPVVPTASDQPT